MADTATSLLAFLPTVPSPPHHGTFASLSSAALLSLCYTDRVRRHPLIVMAWAGGTYLANTWWLKLKLKQVTAKVFKQVDGVLKDGGACFECRRKVLNGGPRDLAKLLADLIAAKEREEAKKEKKLEAEVKRVAEVQEETDAEIKALEEKIALVDRQMEATTRLGVESDSLSNQTGIDSEVEPRDGDEDRTKSAEEDGSAEDDKEDVYD